MYKKNLILIVLLCQLSGLWAQIVIPVKAGAGDATSVLQAAIEEARKYNGKPVEIRLEQGDYHLYRTSALKQVYYVSNTASAVENPDPTKHIGLWLKNLKNVTLNGGGARLITHGEMTAFVIDGCEHIRLCHFSLQAADPSVVEMTVTDTTAYTATFRIHPDAKYVIEANELRWSGEGWSFKGGIAQTFDRVTNVTNRCGLPTDHRISITEAGEHTIRVEYNRSTGVRPGEVFQIRDAIRDEVCGFIHKSKGVTLEHLNLYFLGNFGIVGQYSENLTYNHLRCEPEYGSGRTCAGFADFLQISGCKGQVRILNSRFEGAQDDPINIHGTHLKVVEQLSDERIRVRFMHHQSYGFDAFFKGDKIGLVQVNSLICLQTARVKKVERIDDYDLLLTLDRPVAPRVKQESLVVENLTWTPEVCIENNYFARIPTRGILVTTRGRVVIRNNVFFRTPMSGIYISDDARSWYESGAVRDVLICDNDFIECGSPVIGIAPENDQPQGAVHRNVRILANRFTLSAKEAIYARWTDGIEIRDNYFVYREKLEPEAFIRLENCVNIQTGPNRTGTRD